MYKVDAGERRGEQQGRFNTCTFVQVMILLDVQPTAKAGTVPNSEPECLAEAHPPLASLSAIADEKSWERAGDLFRALGDIGRLRLAGRLIQRECCVTELAGAEGESISTISQRLRVLRAENIVVRRRRGKHVNYALADEHMTDMIKNAVMHASEP